MMPQRKNAVETAKLYSIAGIITRLAASLRQDNKLPLSPGIRQNFRR
jgi:hypothetical protein